MHQPVTPSLTMKRRLNASPAEVYQAWTDPDLLVRWFGPENVVAQEAEIDPRVDGAYRVVMIENTGERHEVLGRYLEVVENERLVFSWSWITTPERSFGSNHVVFGGMMLPVSAMLMSCCIETG